MRRVCIALACVVCILAAPHAEANHFYTDYGWRDKHYRWPAQPSGYSQIVQVFGKPCNSYANDNKTNWTAQDDQKVYPVNYHYKLGGYGKFYGGTGSKNRSSNLNNDVRGHIRNEHLGGYVTHGIYGYVCRKISGSSKWSTHAWGIAVDINTAANPFPTYRCKSMPDGLIRVWTAHRWVHGKSFGDCMHFQYASDY
ncbi:MAG: M15 family metallopeptidase [Actinomycetota bacterium]